MVDLQERDLFLREVLNAPDDDAPRLIYADWLEESGDPRGEFIRVQCELAQRDELDPYYYECRDRSSALLAVHGEGWAKELKQDVRKSVYRRGFIDTITMRARAFVKEAGELFQSVPVNWIRFNYVKGAGEQLAGCEALQKLRCLDLSNLKIPDLDLVALFQSPHLTNLQSLKLTSAELSFGRDVGAALANCRSSETIKYMKVSGSTSDDGFFGALSRGPGFPKLEHLAIGADYYFDDDFPSLKHLHVPSLNSLEFNGRLTVAECENVVELPLTKIKSLDLSRAELPAKGIELIARAGALDEVQSLRLPRCTAGPKALSHVLAENRLSNCKQLDIRQVSMANPMVRQDFVDKLTWYEPLAHLEDLALSELDEADLQGLLNNEKFASLKSLTLEKFTLNQAGTESLCYGKLAKSLRRLRLSSIAIPYAPMNILCEAYFPNLLVLDLSNSFDDMFRLDTEGLNQLITSGAFPNLRELRMDYASGNDETLEKLANESHVPELRRISFQYNRSRVETCKTVLQSERLPKLSELVVSGSLNSGAGKSLIKEFGHRIVT